MGVGAYLEPLTVVVLLFGGAWINRARDHPTPITTVDLWHDHYDPFSIHSRTLGGSSVRLSPSKRSLSPSLLPSQEHKWRTRETRFFGRSWSVQTPNTAVFRGRFLSRVLRRFPFLVEAWYWALIYWVYQLGRAFTALTVVEGTVHVARQHALQLIAIEKRWHIFWELPIQRFFMGYPTLMMLINWLYSFIHIPGTIAFLVWLFYYSITSQPISQEGQCRHVSALGPGLFQARRRTMAVCNLLAFVVFTMYPCMPPRLLSDPAYNGPAAELAKSFGFVDTVHGEHGASSVWTQNRFCNQYAAMPSLHFGYSLLVGLTIMTIPLSSRRRLSIALPFFNQSHPELAPRILLPCGKRLICIAVGFIYPFAILVAIVSTANHFILDAVAGAIVCCVGWYGNKVLLNLLPLEDYFLWCLRLHKPSHETLVFDADYDDGCEKA